MEASVRPADTDAEHIIQARAGSQEARRTLVQRYWRSAYRVAYFLVHDIGLAEDLAQESLVAAFGALDGFDENRPFKPWLERIAANRAYDWHRRQARAPEIVDSDLVEVALDESPAEDIPNVLPDERLMGAIAGLEMRFRVAVVLRYLVEMTPREISQLTGAPEGTVRTRIHRGLGRLREELERGAVDEQAR